MAWPLTVASGAGKPAAVREIRPISGPIPIRAPNCQVILALVLGLRYGWRRQGRRVIDDRPQPDRWSAPGAPIRRRAASSSLRSNAPCSGFPLDSGGEPFTHRQARRTAAAQTGDVTNFVPLLLLATIFSLSTDYEVFLLSRIREEYHAGLDNARAVAAGLACTAPVISGAAVLMIAVFGAFAFAGILPIQQLGFGLAFAVAIDVTVIRLVVVPASMRLLGDWNWWLPGRSQPALPQRPALH